MTDISALDQFQDAVPQDIGTEPEEQSSHEGADIYDEFVVFADPEELFAAVVRAGLLDEYRKSIGKVIFEQNRIARVEALMRKEQEEAAVYSAPTLKYRKQFAAIQERARHKIANFEPTEWETVYSGKGDQNGPAKRTWIKKHKDEYLLPGVWSIASRTVNDPKTGAFVSSDCIVRYLADAPKDDPESILVVTQPPGRPAKA